jgi:ribosomal protein S18 acetylase RimI-like enzyme
MNILKHTQLLFLTFVPSFLFCMDQQSSNTWVQEARSGQQYGAWITQDRTGKTVLVQGGVISNKGRIIASEPDLHKITSLLADVMAGTFVNISEVSKLGWLYAKFNSWYTGKTHRDRLYEAYLEKIGAPLCGEVCENIYFIVTVSDVSGENTDMLGAALFDIQANYEYGIVELDIIATKPEAQSRGLSTILASTIFKFLPQAKRVILDVLQNNTNAIRAYEHFGFTRYDKNNCIMALVDPEYHYEYLTEKPSCQRLQECAATFNE